MKTSITVADGYTVEHEDGARLCALRHGEPWRDLTGDGLVLALVQRIEELEKAIDNSAKICEAVAAKSKNSLFRSAAKICAAEIRNFNEPYNKSLLLARQFHETYERLAPQFDYKTKAETQTFDPASANGKLMVAVCDEIIKSQTPVVQDTAQTSSAPNGTWLWGQLMEWCKNRKVAPANYSDLFAICGEAYKLNVKPEVLK
jgi:hypothetical protein